jgi:cytochrome c
METMHDRTRRATVIAAACGGLFLLAMGRLAGGDPSGAARDAGADLEVQLCDGETRIQVAQADVPTTRAQGQQVADELMQAWRAKNPGSNWIAEEQAKHTILPPADNADVVGFAQGQTYGLITPQDVLVWQRETVALVTRGSQVFHSGDELGSTIAVSCDMCHPNAANTHPETYPKFQTQLGRAVLLRDMINWCIEHPVRGAKLAEDDPKMHALEAYIMAQRKGTPMNYGKR